MTRSAILGAIFASAVCLSADAPRSPLPAPSHLRTPAPPHLRTARQMVLVVTPGWDDVRGELRRFERMASTADSTAGWNATSAGDSWQAVGGPTTIVVGKNGTAWDPTVAPVVPGPIKVEGDGRSPAGVFSLGTAFGYAPLPDARWLKLPYLHVTEGIECVDDPASSVYNKIVNRREVSSPDWKSSENMREVGEAYRWGVVVNYNTSPAVSTRGSCIFLHSANLMSVGEGGKGTAGCTAMLQTDLRVVMGWLDPAASPVLVQLPRAAYDKLKSEWQLP